MEVNIWEVILPFTVEEILLQFSWAMCEFSSGFFRTVCLAADIS